MLLSTFNPTQISNAVWTAVTRTLTADPATDAGAATLVWNRATGSAVGGSYGALVATNLDATVSSRAPSATALSTAQWTNTRASNLDNLDATVSSRAPSATALSTAQWTNTRASNLDNLDATVSSRATQANVWTNATRTLTASGFTSAVSQTKANLASSSTVTVQPAAGHVQHFIGSADSTQMNFNLYDGTYAYSVSANGIMQGSAVLTNSVYMYIHNSDGASSHNYMYASHDFTV
jgi:hypothetical protein